MLGRRWPSGSAVYPGGADRPREVTGLACVVIYSGLRRSPIGSPHERSLCRWLPSVMREPRGIGPPRGVDDAKRLRVVGERLEEETTLWQEFLRAHRTIIDKMAEQMMRDHNLPLEWFDVLIHLAE